MAEVWTIENTRRQIDPDLVFRDFKDGESMEDLANAYNVHRYVIEKLVREECRRKDSK